MTAPVVRLEKLSKGFAGKSVLQGVDLAIEPGTVLELLGANGSGNVFALWLMMTAPLAIATLSVREHVSAPWSQPS